MKTKGQSLVEVLVALGVVSLLLVALLSIVSMAVKNSRSAKDRTLAVELAQEGMELMRAYRDYSWTEFSDKAGGANWWLPASWTVETGLSEIDCDSSSLMAEASSFSRCVKLVDDGSGGIEVEVTVFWGESGQTQQTTQTSKLSRWGR